MSEAVHEIQNTNRYLVFFIGTEEFAIPLLTVREVIAMPTITRLPHTPPHFLGVMNLRGQVIPVTDLRLKLNIKTKASSETSVILSDIGETCVGYVVDSIHSVHSANDADIAPPPDLDTGKSKNFVKGVLKNDSRLILLLDLPELFEAQDRSIVSKNSLKIA